MLRRSFRSIGRRERCIRSIGRGLDPNRCRSGEAERKCRDRRHRRRWSRRRHIRRWSRRRRGWVGTKGSASRGRGRSGKIVINNPNIHREKHFHLILASPLLSIMVKIAFNYHALLLALAYVLRPTSFRTHTSHCHSHTPGHYTAHHIVHCSAGSRNIQVRS